MNGIPLSQVHPNNWNPNEMTTDEYAELLAELKHLGRVPKPVVLRQNGGDYEIIDGEQTYKAALEVGWTELQPGWYEVIQADDFEAMRQTYKRNQHGRHHRLKEGELFRRMMDAKGLNRSEVAEQAEVSEGTVRNALEYVEALEIRNSYEGWYLERFREALRDLPIRQVRALNELPAPLGDCWLKSGPEFQYLDYEEERNDRPAKVRADMPDPHSLRGIPKALWALVGEVNCLRSITSPKVLVEMMRQVALTIQLWGRKQRLFVAVGRWEDQYVGALALDPEKALPYLKEVLTSRWVDRFGKEFSEHIFRDCFEAISRPVDETTAEIILPLESFQAWMHYPEAMNLATLREALRKATVEIGGPEVEESELWAGLLGKYAPLKIREAKTTTAGRYILWQCYKSEAEDGTEQRKTLIEGALDRTLAYLAANGEPDKYGHDAAKRFAKEVSEAMGEAEVEATLHSLGTKEDVLKLVMQNFGRLLQLCAFVGAERKFETIKAAVQPALDRLNALPEPELVLIAAMLLGRRDYLEIWLSALGWKFEAKEKQDNEDNQAPS